MSDDEVWTCILLSQHHLRLVDLVFHTSSKQVANYFSGVLLIFSLLFDTVFVFVSDIEVVKLAGYGRDGNG